MLAIRYYTHFTSSGRHVSALATRVLPLRRRPPDPIRLRVNLANSAVRGPRGLRDAVQGAGNHGARRVRCARRRLL